MPFYVRRSSSVARQVWEFTDREAVRLDVPVLRQGPGNYFRAEPGETVLEAIRRQASGFFPVSGESPFVEMEVPPNTYFPRMVRGAANGFLAGLVGYYPGYDTDRNIAAVARVQLTVLTGLLEKVCQTVHPVEANMEVFGHDLRNLLILAATEVEAQWRGILVANDADARNTNDYVKLLGPMHLAEYEVAFVRFPWLDPVKPFETWDPTSPTKSLSWYDAYNATKHDREVSFSQATLRHCLSSMAAIVVLLAAQFSGRILGYGIEEIGSEREMAFKIVSSPKWTDGQLYSLASGVGREWVRQHYPFSGRR